mmetsp:Transcript_93059/g.262763  ORF Transcript_93059/g.262763 Transcript_93059/m.262763 type:complete len:683 (+) Transcript_93059:180-2228(+)
MPRGKATPPHRTAQWRLPAKGTPWSPSAPLHSRAARTPIDANESRTCILESATKAMSVLATIAKTSVAEVATGAEAAEKSLTLSLKHAKDATKMVGLKSEVAKLYRGRLMDNLDRIDTLLKKCNRADSSLLATKAAVKHVVSTIRSLQTQAKAAGTVKDYVSKADAQAMIASDRIDTVAKSYRSAGEVAQAATPPLMDVVRRSRSFLDAAMATSRALKLTCRSFNEFSAKANRFALWLHQKQCLTLPESMDRCIDGSAISVEGDVLPRKCLSEVFRLCLRPGEALIAKACGDIPDVCVGEGPNAVCLKDHFELRHCLEPSDVSQLVTRAFVLALKDQGLDGWRVPSLDNVVDLTSDLVDMTSVERVDMFVDDLPKVLTSRDGKLETVLCKPKEPLPEVSPVCDTFVHAAWPDCAPLTFEPCVQAMTPGSYFCVPSKRPCITEADCNVISGGCPRSSSACDPWDFQPSAIQSLCECPENRLLIDRLDQEMKCQTGRRKCVVSTAGISFGERITQCPQSYDDIQASVLPPAMNVTVIVRFKVTGVNIERLATRPALLQVVKSTILALCGDWKMASDVSMELSIDGPVLITVAIVPSREWNEKQVTNSMQDLVSTSFTQGLADALGVLPGMSEIVIGRIHIEGVVTLGHGSLAEGSVAGAFRGFGCGLVVFVLAMRCVHSEQRLS